MGWSTMLTGKGILQQGNYNYNWYVAGIGLGTMLGFAVFIYGGNYLVEQLNDNQNILNWAIGCILSVTVIIQVYKMYRKPVLKPIRNY
jgi:membrane protein DedA with SNARE-associated domain